MSVNYVNYQGCAIDIKAAEVRAANEKPKRTSNAPTEFHKGYKAVAVKADELDNAQTRYEKENRCKWPDNLKSSWVSRHKKLVKRVVLLEAAEVAKRLAEKVGWLHVEIRSIERKNK